MSRFPSAREAKEFLIAKIVEEAQREGAPLSEIERKELYFTESGWTLPDIMEVNDEFDRTYDQGEYEKKIAKLVEHATDGLEETNPAVYQDWMDAIAVLQREDHFILIPIGLAGVGPSPIRSGSRNLGALKIVGLILVFIAGGLRGAFRTGRLDDYFPWIRSALFFVWALVASLVVAYGLMYVIVGKAKAQEVVSDLRRKIGL